MKSKTTIFQNYFLIICIAFGVATVSAQSGCDVNITAKKGRNEKSLTTEGTAYRMVITNNGSASDTFILSAKDINVSCSNPDGSSTTTNVVLNYEFLDAEKKNKITEISLNAGETIGFVVSVFAPNGTAYNRWSCVGIVANSKKCKNYSSSTDLHSKVIETFND